MEIIVLSSRPLPPQRIDRNDDVGTELVTERHFVERLRARGEAEPNEQIIFHRYAI
jgi:hypothetical protein